MPSSLIIVALVVAWLVVLVPMIVRKRQEIARTADSALAARVVRSAEEEPMRDSTEVDEAQPPDTAEVDPEPVENRPPPSLFEPAVRGYRPGRGGFDPDAAAVLAQAKYAFRQRVVLIMIIAAILTGVAAIIVDSRVWWVHAAVDLALVSYLGYLRRQVRIEQEIRERRLARMRAHRVYAPEPEVAEDEADLEEPLEEPEEPPTPARTPVAQTPRPPARPARPGTVVVDVDDEDPAFDDLDRPDNLPYRRAAGE
ncbi:gephyrin-like molybdotransferase receptor GlpR [Actinophytocola sp.]|uniref:divisome protein SepX/GlpR n=1 Tax=Actinophytocola sp. TaxID=1872138 RepID=UPI002D803AA3|nr:gephyrin-like molybdotransferase receptor GlpR [Actinophytocola sp.]HET9140327.1 gephyrin-like molybdotransferase receptor GlpR [Actinophytocola sp.]